MTYHLILRPEAEEDLLGTLDVVFLQHPVAYPAPELRQRRFAAEHHPIDNLYHRRQPCPMHKRAVASKPNFQHSSRVHAVLSQSNGCFAIPIRSDDSMHVDPLNHCSRALSSQNSWGYLRLGR